MKIIYNDATEIAVQQVETYGDYLRILVIGTTPEQLKELFTDSSRTSRMIVQERGQTIATYDGYTSYQWTELRPGKIYGVVIYKPEKTPEAQSAMVQAAVAVAQIQAQSLTDEQALTVKALYSTFDDLVKAKYTAEKQGFKFRDGAALWKTAQDNVTFQTQYRPGQGTESLYTHIDEAHAGTREDPIPAKANMEYEYGKYYSEGNVIYLCKRGGVQNPEEMYGQKIILQYLPSALIGQYFVVVE